MQHQVLAMVMLISILIVMPFSMQHMRRKDTWESSVSAGVATRREEIRAEGELAKASDWIGEDETVKLEREQGNFIQEEKRFDI